MRGGNQTDERTKDIAALVRRTVFVVFASALLAGSAAFFIFFRAAALDHVRDEASALMDTALAVRGYTVDEVRSRLDDQTGEFHRQSVPSYAAQAVFERLNSGGYSYREAALNPTNPDDQATAFEADLIKRFRRGTEDNAISGVRQRDGKMEFYQARPIRIQNEACLECHDTPERAPEAMLAKYGRDRGFGWEMNEVVGIQKLTVPMDKEYATIYEILAIFFVILFVLFIIVSIVVVRPLQRHVIRPLRDLAAAAERASLRGGDDQLPTRGALEVRRLATAVQRLRHSLQIALGERDSGDKP